MSKVNVEKVLKYHRGGKVRMVAAKPLKGKGDLAVAYTPGVAAAVKAIAAKPESVFDYTAKSNMVAVVTDGTAILGLGDLGPEASLPVMEGKCVLFKEFAGVDAFPIALDTCRLGGRKTGKTDPKRVIAAVKAIAPMFGGINLEDIASPACFEIEDTLKKELDIPFLFLCGGSHCQLVRTIGPMLGCCMWLTVHEQTNTSTFAQPNTRAIRTIADNFSYTNY